jgi:hypothetical protein
MFSRLQTKAAGTAVRKKGPRDSGDGIGEQANAVL